MDKLFSIIIPCYNASDYIDTAIGSVVRQTVGHDKYEVIAVNDASTDDTLSHLNDWAGRYPDLIRVITYDTNLRQGGARNIAIKESCGEYVCFLDADDWMEEDALEAFEQGLESGDHDMVTVHSEENPSFSINGSYPEKHFEIEHIYEDTHKNDLIAADLGYVCCSIYRKRVIEKNKLWFPEHLAYEDIYWQRMIKFYIRSAAVVDHVAYHHYIHEESTINKKNAPHQLDRLTSYERYLSECNQKGFLKRFYKQILDDTMETYLFNSYYMFFILMDDIPDVYDRIRETIYKYFPDWESAYDDQDLPMVFEYLLKFIKKAKYAKPTDLQAFKDAILELSE